MKFVHVPGTVLQITVGQNLPCEKAPVLQSNSFVYFLQNSIPVPGEFGPRIGRRLINAGVSLSSGYKAICCEG